MTTPSKRDATDDGASAASDTTLQSHAIGCALRSGTNLLPPASITSSVRPAGPGQTELGDDDLKHPSYAELKQTDKFNIDAESDRLTASRLRIQVRPGYICEYLL